MITQGSGTPEQKRQNIRSLLGWMCAYGIFYTMDQGGCSVNDDVFMKGWNKVFDFGWAKDDVERFFYFDDGPKPVTHTGRDTRLTVQKRGGRALLMFGSIGEAEDVTFDATGLNLGANLTYTDEMTGERLQKPSFRMDRHGHKLIRVEPASFAKIARR